MTDTLDQLRERVQVTGPHEVEIDIFDDDMKPTGETYTVHALEGELEHNGVIYNTVIHLATDAPEEIVTSTRQMLIEHLAHEVLQKT